MAGEKTEQPTPKRRGEARSKGQIAKSNDLCNAIVMGVLTCILMVYGAYIGQYMVRIMYRMLRYQLGSPHPMTTELFLDLLRQIFFHAGMTALPFLLGAMLAGIAGNMVQVGFLYTTETIKPKLDKLNFINGFKRFGSPRTLMELAKNLLKMVIVAWCAYGTLSGKYDHLMAMGRMPFLQSWMFIFQVGLQLMLNISLTLLVMGIADYYWQKHQLEKSLKMSKQEVKDEMKNAEGDPKMKSKVRSMGQAILRNKMIKAVKTADVVVTNPTHYAVAIQYDPDVAPAPRVVAKGVDFFALKLREVAAENGVPIQENKPLARSLYASVEVNHMIPPELFITVAEVLAYVFKRNKGRSKNPHIRRMAGIRPQGGNA